VIIDWTSSRCAPTDVTALVFSPRRLKRVCCLIDHLVGYAGWIGLDWIALVVDQFQELNQSSPDPFA
jgi:hypothetical protein